MGGSAVDTWHIYRANGWLRVNILYNTIPDKSLSLHCQGHVGVRPVTQQGQGLAGSWLVTAGSRWGHGRLPHISDLRIKPAGWVKKYDNLIKCIFSSTGRYIYSEDETFFVSCIILSHFLCISIIIDTHTCR